MLCVSILTHEQGLQAIKHTWKGYCTMHFVRELFVYSTQMLALHLWNDSSPKLSANANWSNFTLGRWRVAKAT